jgi:hypothetical protein
MTSGGTSNAACSQATRGSPTVTTTQRSTYGSSGRTRSCFSTRRGGPAQVVRSSADFESQSARCPKVATTPYDDDCAMNGGWSASSGVIGVQSPSRHARSSPSTGDMRRCTYSAQGELRESFSGTCAVTNQVSEHSQGGDTGSNPVGLQPRAQRLAASGLSRRGGRYSSGLFESRRLAPRSHLIGAERPQVSLEVPSCVLA